MPGAEKSFKRSSKVTNRNFIRPNAEVGAKLHNGEKRTTTSQNQIRRRKDNKQQVKSSKYSAPRSSNGSSSKLPHKQSAFDLLPSPETSEDERENDEFDSMCFSSTFSLSERLLGSDEKSTQSLMIKPEKHFHDGLSDDEEYQNMSEAERNEHFKPKLEDLHNTTLDKNINLDGMIKNISSSSEDEDFVSTTTYEKRKRGRKISSDEDESTLNIASKKASISLSLNDSNELPDVEKRTILNDISPSKINGDSFMNGRPDNDGTNEAAKKKCRKSISTLDLTEDQRKKLIIPPREPAKLQNRRRATLVVTPASLLGHWLTQIHQHVDDSVNLKVAVHYGQCKALLGTELEDNDIVLTTYGTVGAEYRSYDSGPLLRAKWLRVVLDEGHFIKNHNSQTAKACYELNTRRKWIVSGTPIQNNLTELWALLKWLNVEPYATHRPLYKRQIEHAVKHGHPHGLQRLQTLMQLICLRRTKSDQINGKPIVQLPKKTVSTKELDFTEEERTVYKSFESKGREIILRYQRKGTLLQNYAHVFAVMMRLRQLCCHKELLPIDWKDVNMQELEEQVRKEMEAEENSAGQMTGNDNSETQNRNIQLAEQLRDMIKEGLSDECSICLSEMTQPVITPCAHVYCRGCITPYIERSENNLAAQCPLCRGSLTKNGLLEAAYSDEDEEHCIRQKDPFEDITIEISSSKINEVLRQLEIAKKKGKGEKIIIVSQFTKLLSVIQPLLDEKGYHWTRLDGSMSVQVKDNVISHFQDESQDSPQVLLLSLRAGGVGLNLTAARKLILLDPAWNPATEEQCFDRIHRLGQTEDVEIIRLIMKDRTADAGHTG
jgi:SNF2 family DNA or RNA helicase